MLEVIAADFEERGHGMIIGISSVAGERGRQSNYIYGSAKAGFNAYLSGLRNRLSKRGVHVMTVLPGFINTKMTASLDLPGLLTAQPEEVAEDIYKAFQKKKNFLYTKWFWRWIMLIIKYIPEPVFKRMGL
jgi:short-subunit dehydrogenase